MTSQPRDAPVQGPLKRRLAHPRLVPGDFEAPKGVTVPPEGQPRVRHATSIGGGTGTPNTQASQAGRGRSRRAAQQVQSAIADAEGADTADNAHLALFLTPPATSPA